MKIYSNFAAFSAKNNFKVFVCVVFFIATNTASYAAYNRLSISNGCCAQKPVIVLCGMEKDSLSLLNYFNFSFMQRTMKSKGKSNNSTLTLPSAHETGIATFNIEKNKELPILSLSDYPSEIQSVLSFLIENGKPVTLVFNITNNNMSIGDSDASNICMITGHDNNSIGGHGNQIKKDIL